MQAQIICSAVCAAGFNSRDFLAASKD
jgi:hypothetical protein